MASVVAHELETRESVHRDAHDNMPNIAAANGNLPNGLCR